jgi:CBS domain-containing protein
MNDMRVRNVMTNLVLSVSPDDSLVDAARRMSRNNISGAPVVEGGKAVGVVSEVDLVRATLPPTRLDTGASLLDRITAIMRAKPITPTHALKIKDVMSHPAITISPDKSIREAAQTLHYRGVKRLPVVDKEDYVVGIVTRADLMRALMRTNERLAEDVAVKQVS